MKISPKKIIAASMVFLVVGFPGRLSARDRRGADLKITRADGRQVRGELIAVKADSLLLLGLDGKDESVDIADISTIRIVRRSKAWPGFIYGFVPGAVGGAKLGHENTDDLGWLGYVLGGLVLGTTTGLVGLVAGWASGLDAEISLGGLPEAEKARILAKLGREAREPGASVLSRRIPRFRLNWQAGFDLGKESYSRQVGGATFRFPGDLPPEEAGPYSPSSFSAWNDRQTFILGRVTLAYDLTRRLVPEIEFHTSRYQTFYGDWLKFTSTLDGIEYLGEFGSYELVSSTSLLVGLTFRPFPQASLPPHVLEVGVAAGPAWIGRSIAESSWEGTPVKVDTDMTWTARVRVSHDYYFNRTLSLGTFAEYRWLRADIPPYAFSEPVEFFEYLDIQKIGNSFLRMTEMSYPGRTVSLGGFVFGLRFGFCF